MRQRTVGILGGALLVGGVVLAIASGVAANRIAPVDRTAVHQPNVGALPRHRGPGQPGQISGDPRRGGFPRPGPVSPITPSPTTSG
jgi:hypothetical protein